MLEALRQDGQPHETGWPYLAAVPADPAHWCPPAGVTEALPPRRRSSRYRQRRRHRRRAGPGPPGSHPDEAVAFVRLDRPGPHRPSGCERNSPEYLRRHAVVAVGHGEARGQRAVLVRNSWGPGWGDGGHGWLTETFLKPRVFSASPSFQEGRISVYLAVKPQPDCASAWLEAVRAVDAQPGHEAHNVVIDVADPTAGATLAHPVVACVDEFLIAHVTNPSRRSPTRSFRRRSMSATGIRRSLKGFTSMFCRRCAAMSAGRATISSA